MARVTKGERVINWFEEHSDEEFLKFDSIPPEERRHVRSDLCAMLYLHDRLGGMGDAVVAASHDEIWLAWRYEKLTEADVVYLLRCGVRYSDGTDSLCMFV